MPAAQAGWPVSVEAASDVAVTVGDMVLSPYLGRSLVTARDVVVVTVTNELGEDCGTLVGVVSKLAVFTPLSCGLSTKDGGPAEGH